MRSGYALVEGARLIALAALCATAAAGAPGPGGGPGKSPDTGVPIHCCPAIHLKVGLLNATLDPWYTYNPVRYGNDRWGGYIPDVSHTVAAHMGGRVTFVPLARGTSAQTVREMLRDGVINMVPEQLTEVSFNREHAQNVSYTVPFKSYWHAVMSKIETSTSSGWGLLDPFAGGLWLAFGLSVPVIGCAAWFTEAFPVESGEDWELTETDFPRRPGILFGALYYASETLMTGGTDWGGMRTWPGRLVCLSGLWLSLVFTATYTANLASILTTQKTSLAVPTLSVLSKSTVCHPSHAPHASLETYVGTLNVPPATLPDEAHLQHCMASLDAGNATGVVASEPLVMHARSRSPICSQLGVATAAEFAPQHLAFAVGRGVKGEDVEDLHERDDDALFVDLLSGGIIGVQLNDRLSALDQKYFSGGLCSSTASSPVLTLDEMKGLFIITGTVAGLALLMRAVESSGFTALRMGKVKPDEQQQQKPDDAGSAGTPTAARRQRRKSAEHNMLARRTSQSSGGALSGGGEAEAVVKPWDAAASGDAAA
eukprot:TRINITY_DN13777_c0_g1_i1.p1 TRINITY_DN13777_c0_g1~~TRINITY_DN13777_c0_g1_i1.p1  ORF type:complete len:541 (+),score=32.00 TRINITY_DN13777_c0_g1_i1:43-1665(+)